MLYLESGLFREVFGEDGFRTLVITTGPRRLKNLRELVEGQGSRLFLFSTFDEVQTQGIVGPVWHFPFEKAAQPLV